MIHIIVGASGYLGSSLLNSLASEENVIATYRTKAEPIADEKWVQLDVGNNESIDKFFNELDQDEKYTFYFLAAMHHPDKVEENWKSAWQINVTGLAYFLSKMPKQSDLIYSSTDNVYGESVNFHSYTEESPLNPVNEYGKQKGIAENLVLSRGYKVARYCFLIGPSRISKKHFYDVIVESCNTGQGIDLMNDSYRSIISFDQAASITIELCEKYWKAKLGVINIASDSVMSKFDIGLKIVPNESCHLIRSISFDSQKFFLAKRPKNVLLNNSKLKMLINSPFIDCKL